MPSLKKNFFYNICYQILILIVPIVTSPYISRILGPEGLGTYSVTTAIAKYFTLFAMLGMMNYGNRNIAKCRGDKEQLSVTFCNMFYFQIIVSSVVSLIFLAYAFLLGWGKYSIVILCQIPYVISTIFDVSWFYFGMENFKGVVARNAVVKILSTAAIFCFVNDKNDTWIYVLITAIGFLAGQLCLWPYVWKNIQWKAPKWRLIISHFKPNCILMTGVIAVSIYTLMDKIMIELLAGRLDVGYYENTEKIFTIANNVAGATGAVMLPRLSALKASGENTKFLKYIEKSMKYIMIIAIAIAFGIAGVSNCFAVVYFGPGFEACGELLFVIALAVIFYAWSNIIRCQFLLPNDMDGVYVTATVIAAIVNLILNCILIPWFGALGAVIGTVGAQFAEMLYQSIRVRKLLPIKKYVLGAVPFMLIGCVMLRCCKLLENIMGISIATLLVQVATGASLYIIASFLFLYFTKDDLIMKILKRFRPTPPGGK